jgi:hypothetical protein
MALAVGARNDRQTIKNGQSHRPRQNVRKGDLKEADAKVHLRIEWW